MSQKLVAVTHNDRFHADDVYAMATLQIFFGKEIVKIYRTRDQKIIDKGDIVFDVGNVYDAKKNKFDHHQTEGAGERENGVPYASFGLVWKKFGRQICGSSKIAEIVDKQLVQPIDAGDNGFSLCENKIEGVNEYSQDRMCYVFGSTWKEKENYDKAFFEVVKIARKILEREIVLATHKTEALPLVRKAYAKSKNKNILVLDNYYPWSDFVKDKKEILFVIYPNKNDKYFRLNAVSDKNFLNRKDLPKEWAGLRDDELEKVTGIKGAKFCHRKLFLAVVETQEAAIELAELALKK